MNPSNAVELVREAALMAMVLGAPLLVVGMVVGLVTSLMQALTQIQDQTVSAVPKILAMVFAMILFLPWLTDRMLAYSRGVLRNIPVNVSR
jgi:flagellar biosynthetic protein FliQ